jgi:type I thyroxine 5'-deiodinase
MTEEGSPVVEEPLDLGERTAVAKRCMSALALRPMPAVVDGIGNEVEAAYEAWPDRLFLVDREGRIAYRGGPGPFGFKPDELADALEKELAREQSLDSSRKRSEDH